MIIFKTMNNVKRMNTRVARALKAILLGVMVVTTCSCEDFLTISPTDKIVFDDFWKSKVDVDNAVAESYRLMTQKDFTYRLIVWGEMRGDNVIAGNNVGLDIDNILEANLLPTNDYASWAPFYKVINNCNQVIKYAPLVLNEDPNFTQGDLNVACGQMLAIRALCHFYLVRSFRNIPLLLEAKVDDSQDLYQAQVDPIVVLDSCLNDLYKAETLVLTSGNYTNLADNKGRITKDAVRAIIADVCLWKAAFCAQKAAEVATDSKADDKTKADAIAAGAQVAACYAECVKYCDLVLDARMTYADRYFKENPTNGIELNASYPIIYPILPNESDKLASRFPHYPYDALFGSSKSSNDGNGCNNPYESIFELQHNTRAENGNYEIPYFYGSVPGEDLSKFNVGQLSASRYLAVLKNGLYTRTDFRRVDYIDSQAAEDNNSKFNIIKYGHSSTKEDRAEVSNDYNFGKMSYTFLKGSSYYTEDQVNWIVYRITDVMLMKAEALAFGIADEESLNEAYNLVEAVYNRSQVGYSVDGAPVGILLQNSDYLKPTDYLGVNNKAKLQRFILDERQREFAFEGKRWYDLVRMAVRQNSTTEMLNILLYNKYDSNHDEYKMKMATINHLFFPIAERELDTHPGLKQNEAYRVEDN